MERGGRPSGSFARTDFDNRGPFGFSFDRSGNLLVAQFVGGPVETIDGVSTITGAAGSYRIRRDGPWQPSPQPPGRWAAGASARTAR